MTETTLAPLVPHLLTADGVFDHCVLMRSQSNCDGDSYTSGPQGIAIAKLEELQYKFDIINSEHGL